MFIDYLMAGLFSAVLLVYGTIKNPNSMVFLIGFLSGVASVFYILVVNFNMGGAW